MMIETKFGRVKEYDGYLQITSRKEGNHGKKLHRLIYEDYYGEEIPDGFHIHHKDGCTLNNNINNLELLPMNEHISIHKDGENHPMYGRTGEKCIWFGKTGEDHPAHKNHPTIVKAGKMGGKQRYGLCFDGRTLKRMVSLRDLLTYTKELGFSEVEVLGVMKKI